VGEVLGGSEVHRGDRHEGVETWREHKVRGIKGQWGTD